MNRSSCPLERPSSNGNRYLRRVVFVVGCGHSGSTVLTMILGAHPEILAQLNKRMSLDMFAKAAQFLRAGSA